MSTKNPKWLRILDEFIRNLRIDSKEVSADDSTGVQLKPWESQKRFLRNIADGLDDGIRIFYCLKSRQLGISTISLCIDVFWLAMHPGIIGALVTDTEQNRDAFRATLKRYIQSMPDKYRGKSFQIVKDNRNMMAFSNGSRLDFLVAGTKRKANWGEGRGYAFVHLTECGKYGDAEGLRNFEESFAVANPDRLFIYESTANGMNHWYDKYLEGLEDKFTKRSFFIGWWAHPLNRIERTDPRFAVYGGKGPSPDEDEMIRLVKERHEYEVSREQLAWYRWRAAQPSMTEQTMRQNQPWTDSEAFVMTGYSFFQIRVIQQDMVRCIGSEGVEPILYQGYKYWVGNEFTAVKCEQILDISRQKEVELRVWHDPIPNAQYVIGCDPALGRSNNADRHAIEVWRCYADRLVQCAEYATNQVETRQCAWVLAHLAGAYRDCIVSVELTGGHGRAVMTEFQHLRDMMRSDMFAKTRDEHDWKDFLSNARWYLYHRPDSLSGGYAYNFETTGKTKVEIMNQMRDSYITRQLVVNSVPLLNEMQLVVQDGYEIGAPDSGGEHSKDDRVFATALANRAWINWCRQELIQRGYLYDHVMATERGEKPPPQPIVNRIVADYFRTMDDMANRGPTAPKWMTDRGLA